jgi:tRNA modification GTPase
MQEGLHKIVPREDTIVAIATPMGRSGLGIVRMSGKDVRSLARRFLRTKRALVDRQALVGEWMDDAGCPIDEVVATFFEGPRSYTGEDVLEVSAHGNPLVLARIVEAVRSAGARIAAPGEFTLRAVANGKMDLIQAEAVRDFIDAQTQAQARQAQRQLSGALSNRIRPVKERLVDVIARLEAAIDFAEDDLELPDVTTTTVALKEIRQDLEELQGTYKLGRLLANGLRLVIIGKPNVGKSSLFNRFVAADRAIVTEIPGTTRDVLTESVEFDGIPLRFSDTAGIRPATDPVERIGVARSLETLADADLVLVVLDGSEPLANQDEHILGSVQGLPHIVIFNKSDLPPALDEAILNDRTAVRLSAKTGAGFGELQESIRRFLRTAGGDLLSDCLLTNTRQNEAVLRAISALQSGRDALQNGVPHEMALLDLYESLAALNELTGEVVTDDILGRIFSTFCVGK